MVLGRHSQATRKTGRDINVIPIWRVMKDDAKKMRPNTEEEYNKALASEDPTKISKDSQEDLAREAIKKFKSLR